MWDANSVEEVKETNLIVGVVTTEMDSWNVCIVGRMGVLELGCPQGYNVRVSVAHHGHRNGQTWSHPVATRTAFIVLNPLGG